MPANSAGLGGATGALMGSTTVALMGSALPLKGMMSRMVWQPERLAPTKTNIKHKASDRVKGVFRRVMAWSFKGKQVLKASTSISTAEKQS